MILVIVATKKTWWSKDKRQKDKQRSDKKLKIEQHGSQLNVDEFVMWINCDILLAVFTCVTDTCIQLIHRGNSGC